MAMAGGLIATVLVATSAEKVLRGTEAPGSPSLIDAPGPPVVPDWDYDAFTGHVGSECVLAQKNRTANNSRFAFWAIPKGPPPSAGWPVYLSFPPWNLPGMGDAENETCGESRHHHYTPPPPMSPGCRAFINATCRFPGANASDSKIQRCSSCVARLAMKSAWTAAGCPAKESPEYAGYEWCRGHGAMPAYNKETVPIFAKPGTILEGCFAKNGSFNNKGCLFMALAGQTWDVRLRQSLLANGVAVLQLNPYSMDLWEWYGQETWDTGYDKSFFKALFASIHAGTFGIRSNGGNPVPLDLSRMVVTGYSVGAQMVSWFFQLQATGQIPEVVVKGGTFFGGGTYGCFQNPPIATAQCETCNVSSECLQIGCSNALVANGITPCCQYCCPEGFTEQHYVDHPEAYASHPAAFLVQTSTLDENSDTCAARNYHTEMRKHGADSTLMLIPADQERCSCVGTPGVEADTVSAYAERCNTPVPGFLAGLANSTPCTLPPKSGARPWGECESSGSGERCMLHTMGFGSMIDPLMKWVKRVI